MRTKWRTTMFRIYNFALIVICIIPISFFLCVKAKHTFLFNIQIFIKIFPGCRTGCIAVMNNMTGFTTGARNVRLLWELAFNLVFIWCSFCPAFVFYSLVIILSLIILPFFLQTPNCYIFNLFFVFTQNHQQLRT